ncbi:rta-like protein [Stemphylium lycopersici]|uniref:Rta-like protein n=1 Tax=Stemphylium lycopersici TaxID=183478 RepID=A0A364N4C4_STELY|nr:rta-like protein [Stemphylium lycopersici]RAR11437.1 rta-like protein [Stemphylium lycopersici]
MATSRAPEIMSVPRTLPALSRFSEREMFIIKGIAQGRPQIGQFLIVPSFRVNHHKTFARHLHNASPLVHDALIAAAALLAYEYEPEPFHEDRTIGHRRAASAISALRSLKSLEPGDLSTFLMLAVSAITFALYISGSSLAICRHTLMTIKPMYDTSTEFDSDCLALLICLIEVETEECLLLAEVPTLRFKAELADGYVDRFIGIAASMLTHLYDICKISNMLRKDERPDPQETTKALDAMEFAVSKWIPTIPKDFVDRFLQEEVVSLLAQARVYRWFVLLLIHRIRHPYGTELAAGATLSDAILRELWMVLKRTERSMPCVTVAFMVACFELTDRNNRQLALEKIDVFIEYSKEMRARIKDQLKVFWTIKDIRGEVHWCDIITLLAR